MNKKIEQLAKKVKHPLVSEVTNLDVAKAVAAIQKEIEASFVRYKKLVGDKSITAIDFYWAGAEVDPYIPFDVMGNVYSGKTLLLDCSGGFTPLPLPTLNHEEVFDDDDLTALFLATSIALAKRAVEAAAKSKAFAALTTARPFVITATPGHDEPKVTLLKL